MTYLLLPAPLIQINAEAGSWVLTDEFRDWCENNLSEPFAFPLIRTPRRRSVFTRFDSRCYMLDVCPDDAVLIIVRYPDVTVGDPDEEPEENNADRALFRYSA